MLFIAAPLIYSMLGRYWSEGRMNALHLDIFLLWYRRKKPFFIACSALLILLSLFFTYLSESIFVLHRAIFCTFGWICIGFILDFFVYTIGVIDQNTSLKASFMIVRSEIHRAVRRRKLSNVLSYYEMLFVLMGDMLQKRNFLASEDVDQDIIIAATVVADAMPKLTLYQKNSDYNDTLLDRMIFLESLTAKRVTSLVQDMMQEYRKKGDTTGIEQLFAVIMQLFLLFHERYPSIGFVVLQSTCTVIVDAMRMPNSRFSQDNPIVQFAIILSEGIKAILDRSISGQKESLSSVQRVLKMVEVLMSDLFRIDRSINPALLMQPFAEVANYLADPRFEKIPDREALLSQLKQHLSQFAILETLSHRFDIQGIRTDTEATYREDLPFQSK